jgi:hypothetical protein
MLFMEIGTTRLCLIVNINNGQYLIKKSSDCQALISFISIPNWRHAIMNLSWKVQVVITTNKLSYLHPAQKKGPGYATLNLSQFCLSAFIYSCCSWDRNTPAQLIVLSGLSSNRVVGSFDLTSLVIKWISTGFHSFYCRDFDQDNTTEGQTSIRWKHLTSQNSQNIPAQRS